MLKKSSEEYAIRVESLKVLLFDLFFVVDIYDMADDVNYRFVFLADLSLYSLIRPFISGMLISRWIVHS